MSQNFSLPRIPAIDGLRGLALLAVILDHSFLYTPTTAQRPLDPFLDTLFVMTIPLAIEVFFALSGFLITVILDSTRDAEHPIRTFYIRRALRIVPVYYGGLIFVVLFLRHLPVEMVGSGQSMVLKFLFLTNLSAALITEPAGSMFVHFWSLSLEEQFYFLWPLVMLFVPRHRQIKVCLLVMAISFVGRALLAAEVSVPAALFVSRFDGLAAGAIVGLLFRRNPELLEKWWRKVAWVSLAACIATLFVTLALYMTVKQPGVVLWLTAMPLLASVLFAAIVGGLAVRKGPPPRWLTSPILTSTARYSYGMYAIHAAVITLLFHWGLALKSAPVAGFDLPYRLCFFVLVASISYGVGLVSWHLYEKQFLKLAPRYRYSKQAPPAASVLETLPLPVP